MKYQVKVDGKVFEVEVEKVGGGYASLTPGSLTAAPAAPVAPGDVILILEAMKMENEIVAPCAGTVTLNVKAGETVDTDAVLASVQ